jgi:hypothetical protein
MKVAILSESEADETAVRILVEAITGKQTQPVLHVGLRARGWPSVRDVLRSVLLQLHNHTDAEGFAMVVDTDVTTPHDQQHETSPHSGCRLCQLRKIRSDLLLQSKRRNRPALKTAIGLAIPSIEAWLRSATHAGVNEAAWLNGVAEKRLPYSTRQLKIDLYGTDRPSLALETERMRESATQLARNIAALERNFPNGFGAFARELRSW